ncbi:hypothetical protein CDCA_CDCA11G3247 [Cyanidium caldarium]|uniref:Exportin-1/Importin-beta-like domain-containing protein n=1 Tax=Cyanidium caldarium TaxID=2771 RepID=A0AAV9IY55_CYACA|nr:hypothetical protein CDCA_CDCA11G3247 [Cyanidium caldarium]
METSAEEIRRALEALHCADSSPEQRGAAQARLEAVKKVTDANDRWGIALRLAFADRGTPSEAVSRGNLLASTVLETACRHFGLSLLKDVVVQWWQPVPQTSDDVPRDPHGLSLAQRDQLRDALLQGMVLYAHMAASFGAYSLRVEREKLAEVLSEVALRDWPQRWPQLLPQLLSIGESGVAAAQVTTAVLRCLAEQIVSLGGAGHASRYVVDARRRQELLRELRANAEPILRFLVHSVAACMEETCGDRHDGAVEALEALTTWCEWAPIDVLFATGVVELVLGVLTHDVRHQSAHTPKDIAPLAENCVAALVSRKDAHTRAAERQMQQLLQRLLPLAESALDGLAASVAKGYGRGTDVEKAHRSARRLVAVISTLVVRQLPGLLSSRTKSSASTLEACVAVEYRALARTSPTLAAESLAFWVAAVPRAASMSTSRSLWMAILDALMRQQATLSVAAQSDAGCRAATALGVSPEATAEEEWQQDVRRCGRLRQQVLEQFAVALPEVAVAWCGTKLALLACCLADCMERAPSGDAWAGAWIAAEGSTTPSTADSNLTETLALPLAVTVLDASEVLLGNIARRLGDTTSTRDASEEAWPEERPTDSQEAGRASCLPRLLEAQQSSWGKLEDAVQRVLRLHADAVNNASGSAPPMLLRVINTSAALLVHHHPQWTPYLLTLGFAFLTAPATPSLHSTSTLATELLVRVASAAPTDLLTPHLAPMMECAQRVLASSRLSSGSQASLCAALAVAACRALPPAADRVAFLDQLWAQPLQQWIGLLTDDGALATWDGVVQAACGVDGVSAHGRQTLTSLLCLFVRATHHPAEAEALPHTRLFREVLPRTLPALLHHLHALHAGTLGALPPEWAPLAWPTERELTFWLGDDLPGGPSAPGATYARFGLPPPSSPLIMQQQAWLKRVRVDAYTLWQRALSSCGIAWFREEHPLSLTVVDLPACSDWYARQVLQGALAPLVRAMCPLPTSLPSSAKAIVETIRQQLEMLLDRVHQQLHAAPRDEADDPRPASTAALQEVVLEQVPVMLGRDLVELAGAVLERPGSEASAAWVPWCRDVLGRALQWGDNRAACRSVATCVQHLNEWLRAAAHETAPRHFLSESLLAATLHCLTTPQVSDAHAPALVVCQTLLTQLPEARQAFLDAVPAVHRLEAETVLERLASPLRNDKERRVQLRRFLGQCLGVDVGAELPPANRPRVHDVPETSPRKSLRNVGERGDRRQAPDGLLDGEAESFLGFLDV